jgi:adenosylcobinamide kinase/adenosylcobinamide-phosphate guanylyltransferase
MTVLLECVSNLVANELFERHTAPDQLVDRLCGEIRHIAEQCRNLVIVTNHFEIEDSFDEETRMYAETLDILNEKLSKLADNTIRL